MKALSLAPAKYPITRTEVKETNVSQGVLDAIIDNIVLDQLPRRVLIAMVKNKAFNGSLDENPFYFDHFNINYLACYVDGVQFPAKAYQPDFAHKKYIREYNGLFQALNQNNTSTPINIDRFKYSTGNTIFGFNFAPDISNESGAVGPLSSIKRGSLSIQMKFLEALVNPINVLVFCEFDNMIQIDKEMQVFMDYN